MATLWSQDTLSYLIYSHDPNDVSVLGSFYAPDVGNGSPRDLAWDGEFLWSSDSSLSIISKIDPSDGSVVDSIDVWSLGHNCYGLTYDGASLWFTDSGANDKIVQITTSGSIQTIYDSAYDTEFSFRTSNNNGLTWGNDFLYVSDDADLAIYKLDPADGSTVGKFDYGAIIGFSARVRGMAFDGTNIWVTDYNNGSFHVIDFDGGTLISTYASPSTNPNGLTWQGDPASETSNPLRVRQYHW